MSTPTNTTGDVDVVKAKVKNFKLLESDVILTGFVRSGTTIISEMIWLLKNNFDFARATSEVNDDRMFCWE